MFFHWTLYFYLVNNKDYLRGNPKPIVAKSKHAVLPTKTADGPQVVSLGGWSLGMPSTSGNQDAAWQFIKWATGADGQKAMGLADTKGYQFADFGRKSLYEDASLRKIYPFLDTQLEMMVLGDGKVVRPPMPIYTSLEAVYGLQLNEAMSGASTPEQALETTDMLFNNILSGNQMIPYGIESYDDTLENTVALIEDLSA